MSKRGLTGAEDSKFKVPRETLIHSEEFPERAIVIGQTALHDDCFQVLMDWNGLVSVTFSNPDGIPPRSIQLDAGQIDKVKSLARDLWTQGAEAEYGSSDACPTIVLLDGPYAFSVCNIGKPFQKGPAGRLFQYLFQVVGL